MKKLFLLTLFISSVTLMSCGGSVSFQDGKLCYKNQGELPKVPGSIVYVGTIKEFIDYKYMVTACLTIDMEGNIGFDGSFAVNDIIYIEYGIFNGKPSYKIYSVGAYHDSGGEPLFFVDENKIIFNN